jgi:predicted alpha/beta-fold hydrolase
VATERGGHCAFISRETGAERFWAEARIVEYCAQQSRLMNQRDGAIPLAASV